MLSFSSCHAPIDVFYHISDLCINDLCCIWCNERLHDVVLNYMVLYRWSLVTVGKPGYFPAIVGIWFLLDDISNYSTLLTSSISLVPKPFRKHVKTVSNCSFSLKHLPCWGKLRSTQSQEHKRSCWKRLCHPNLDRLCTVQTEMKRQCHLYLFLFFWRSLDWGETRITFCVLCIKTGEQAGYEVHYPHQHDFSGVTGMNYWEGFSYMLCPIIPIILPCLPSTQLSFLPQPISFHSLPSFSSPQPLCLPFVSIPVSFNKLPFPIHSVTIKHDIYF